jgi:hypothetical protein
MPYEGKGARHVVATADKACVHGQIVSEDGFVGRAFKSSQPNRFVTPAAADDIAIGEEFVLMLGGVMEAPASGNLAAAAVGNDVYINSANNTLGLAAQGITGAALNAGWLPVGKVTEIDVSRNPDVVRINAEVAHLVKGNWA